MIVVRRRPVPTTSLLERARAAASLERGITARELAKETGAPVSTCFAALFQLGPQYISEFEPFKGDPSDPCQVSRYRRRPVKA